MKSLLPASLTGLALTLGITATAAAQTSAGAKPPLNILLFTADDMGWFSPGSMHAPGYTPGVTPNLDKFATQALTFERAHVTVAICQPSRGVLATGMYPHTSGVEGFFKAPHPVKTVMSELRDHGYRVGILSKVTHSTPDASFIWDMQLDDIETGHGRNPAQYAKHFREFIDDCKKRGQPFYFMCNSRDPHRPFFGAKGDYRFTGDKEKDAAKPSHIYTPDEVVIPGFLPDLPDIRKEMAQYCSSARRCDDVFGAVMKVLEDEGLADNTMVIFLSDNGMSVPFSKTNAYYNSTRTPLMIRYPSVTKPGSVDETDFVGGVDYMPTVLDACGFKPPAGVNGRSYLPLLRGEKQDGRDKVFTQIYETSGKKRYPMFTVEDANYILIYNPWSDGKYEFKAESLGGLTFAAMQKAAATDPFIRSRVDLVLHRVPLELYDTHTDFDGLHNLAKDPNYADVVAKLSGYLKDWMKQYDPTVLAAFTSFPNDKTRSAYMAMEMKLPKENKANANPEKTKKKNKPGKSGAAGSEDEDNE